MPYVITTTVDRAPDWPGAQSRRAVATLEEARAAAVNVWYASEAGDRDEHSLARRDICLHLPEAGGTIGPLPDGTVIEVQRITPGALAEQVGFAHYITASDAAIINAYNAQHAH